MYKREQCYGNRNFVTSDSYQFTMCCQRYMSLASCIHKLEPNQIPQVIAQIPPPPIDVPMPIRKALTIDGEDKVVNHLLCGEYEMTNTSWSKLQKKYSLSKNKIYSALKGKRRPRGSQYQQKKKTSKKISHNYNIY